MSASKFYIYELDISDPVKEEFHSLNPDNVIFYMKDLDNGFYTHTMIGDELGKQIFLRLKNDNFNLYGRIKHHGSFDMSNNEAFITILDKFSHLYGLMEGQLVLNKTKSEIAEEWREARKEYLRFKEERSKNNNSNQK